MEKILILARISILQAFQRYYKDILTGIIQHGYEFTKSRIFMVISKLSKYSNKLYVHFKIRTAYIN